MKTLMPTFVAVPLTLMAVSSAAQTVEPRTGDLQVNTFTTNDQKDPLLGVDTTGGFVVLWDDRDRREHFFQLYSAEGDAVGGETQLPRESGVFRNQLALAKGGGGEFVVAWQEEGDQRIHAQRFDASGSEQGASFLVPLVQTEMAGEGVARGTATSWVQYEPSVAMADDGDFVIAWQSQGQDGDGAGIFAQLYASDGTEAGPELRVNDTTAGGQRSPRVASTSGGDFVVAWTGPDAHLEGVFARQFQSSGVAVGQDLQVNSWTTGSQSTPDVDVNGSGEFVVAWSSFAQDSPYSGVFAQRFASNGVKDGGEIQVATDTSDHRGDPHVVVDDRGAAMVVWTHNSLDGSAKGLYGQVIGAGGVKSGAETRVNDETYSIQEDGVLGTSGDGTFVVAWESYLQDGADLGIFHRQWVFDHDEDGVADVDDNCPLDDNPAQLDHDEDGAGDVCDADDDDDLVLDLYDNCPFTPNPDQIDLNGDGVGDACGIFQDGFESGSTNAWSASVG